MTNVNTYTTLASDLLEEVPNRYELTLKIAEVGKRLKEEARHQRQLDPFALAPAEEPEEKEIYRALYVMSSEVDLGDGLIG